MDGMDDGEQFFAGKDYLGMAGIEERPEGSDLLFALTLKADGTSEIRSALTTKGAIDLLEQTLQVMREGRGTFDGLIEEAARKYEPEGG